MLEKNRYSPKKYAIFDMDGIMFRSPEAYFLAHQQLAKQLNAFDYTLEQQLWLMNQPRTAGQSSIQAFLELIGYRVPEDNFESELSNLESKRNEIFGRIINNGSLEIVKSGLISMVKLLNTRGIPAVIATASNSEQVDNLFSAQTQLDQSHFTAIVSSDQDPNYKKTRNKNRIIQLAIDKMRKNLNREIIPQDCMMFEDSSSGVNAAKEAGIGLIVAIPDKFTRIGALTGNKFEFSYADIIAQNFSYLHHIWRNILD